MTMLKHEVPRAIIFIDKGREAIIFGIEEGSMYVLADSLHIP